MRLNHYKSGRPQPWLLWLSLIALCVPCNAGPTLVSAISTTGADIKLSVSAQGLPQVKRLTLTFVYDPLAMDPLRAIVSSSLPSVAVGAVLDTSAKKLILDIIATSTITIADGARVTVFSAPLLQSGTAQNSLRLAEALCIDKDNAPIVLSIANQTLAVRRAFEYAPLSAQARPRLPGEVYMLDGRQCSPNRYGAVLAGGGRGGNRVYLSPLRTYCR
jgi:hypothetical protein